MVFCFPFNFIQGKQHCNINNMKKSIIINWFYQFPCNQNTIPINFRTRYLILANLSIKLLIPKSIFWKRWTNNKKCLRWSFLLQLQALGFQYHTKMTKPGVFLRFFPIFFQTFASERFLITCDRKSHIKQSNYRKAPVNFIKFPVNSIKAQIFGCNL